MKTGIEINYAEIRFRISTRTMKEAGKIIDKFDDFYNKPDRGHEDDLNFDKGEVPYFNSARGAPLK